MKDLIKGYLDRGISRRKLLSGLGALGISSVAAKSMATSLSAFQAPPQESAPAPAATAKESPAWLKRVRGTGGKLLIEQLKAAGMQYLFVGCSAAGVSIFDALVDEPNFHIIEAVQEGAVAVFPFLLKGLPRPLSERLVPQRPEQRHHEDQHGDDVVRRVRLAYNRVLLGDRWHQILPTQSLVIGRWSLALSR